MEGGGDRGARSVSVHPLVIINVSDHLTRVRVSNPADGLVLGALFGVQDGLNVHIYDSSELVFQVDGAGQVEIDPNYVNTKREQFSAVFPNFEVLGWYTTGTQVTEREMQIQRKMTEFNESPLFMLLEPTVSPDARSLPITLHESVLHMVNDVPTMVFVDVEFKVDTVESERISLDHVARQAPVKDDKTSVVDAHLKGVHSSVQTLVQQVRIVQRCLQLVAQGKLPKNRALLRELVTVCQQLPVVDPDAFDADLLHDVSDTMLVNQLAALTRGLGVANQLMDKFQSTQADKRKQQHLW